MRSQIRVRFSQRRVEEPVWSTSARHVCTYTDHTYRSGYYWLLYLPTGDSSQRPISTHLRPHGMMRAQSQIYSPHRAWYICCLFLISENFLHGCDSVIKLVFRDPRCSVEVGGLVMKVVQWESLCAARPYDCWSEWNPISGVGAVRCFSLRT